MSFPSTFSAFPQVSPTDRLHNPSHSGLENSQSSAVGQVEAFVGLDGDASVAGTLVYDVRSPDSDGGGHIQTANKGGTGQTSFNKGDILVGQSSSVITKLAVGADGTIPVADSTTPTGIRWGQPGSPTMRVYQASSSIYTWYKPSNLSYLVVEVQANGANGANSGPGSDTPGADGGGAGGYARSILPAASLPLAASILVQAGGAGSLLSYFGSIASARGGSLRTGGIGSIGGLRIKGGDGGPGIRNTNNSNVSGEGGNGGDSYFSSGGGGAVNAQNGLNGGNYGGGGGGGGGHTASGATSGGLGGDGVVIVTEY